jgi:hypothetical protein
LLSSKEDVRTLFLYFEWSGIPAEGPSVTEDVSVAEFEPFLFVCNNIGFGSFVVFGVDFEGIPMIQVTRCQHRPMRGNVYTVCAAIKQG